ncbi:MAG: putative lipid II flippase FtsW [Bacillota bacterium]
MKIKNKAPDFLIIISVLLLLSIGLIMVFSASAYEASLKNDTFLFLRKQFMWALLGVAIMIVTMNIEYPRLKRVANLALLGSMALLIMVLLIGVASHGSSRWLGVGFMRVQPSEIAKLAMVLFMARSLSKHQDELGSFFRGVVPHLLMLGIVSMLILAQPDLGTAVAVAGTTYLMLMAAGSKSSHLGLLALGGIVLVGLAIFLAPYRMERFIAFLDPWKDPADSGFQTIQSLLALGSGGLFGTGLGMGKQKLLYVPERHTDFIFSILGEELGFIGTAVVLILFFIFVWRGFRAALKAPDTFGSLLAVGITSMISLQAIINIGVVTGSLPVTGITLPFLSYGGSSLVFTMLSVGVLLNISRYANR